MDDGFKLALGVCVVLAFAQGKAMAQQLDSRIDNSKRDFTLCHEFRSGQGDQRLHQSNSHSP